MAKPAIEHPLQAEHPPFRIDEGGAVRVGESRVSLDLVVEQYENGMRAEDMARAYDPEVLAWAAAIFARRTTSFLFSTEQSIGAAIDDILLIAAQQPAPIPHR